MDDHQIDSLNTMAFLVRRRRVVTWFMILCVFGYLCACIVLFLGWVNPSLTGQTDQHIAADSVTYMYMAKVVTGKDFNPMVLKALDSFPNTYWGPVLISIGLGNTILIALADFVIFFASLQLFRRSSRIHTGLFLLLLLINPTTTISLLSVNKEIIDLLVIALFCYSRSSGRRAAFWFAISIAVINRFEVSIVLLLYVFVESRANLLRRRRLLTIIALVFLIGLLLPIAAPRISESRFVEANNGKLIVILDWLEMHYLYAVAVLPKILDNFYGEILNLSLWTSGDFQNIANSYVLIFNNLSFLAVSIVLGWRSYWRLRNDWLYLAAVGAVFMAISLIIQPRYFYFCYVLLCFQAAHMRGQEKHIPVPGKRLRSKGLEATA